MFYGAPDNEMRFEGSHHRVDSASKKHPHNRIKVISKMASHKDPISESSVPSSAKKVPPEGMIRRLHSCEDKSSKDEAERNLLSLMQEQLEYSKRMWEQKMREKLKEQSIEISKLKMRVQNNNELLTLKNLEIEKLQSAHLSPVSQLQSKMMDLEAKLHVAFVEQHKLSSKMCEMEKKVQTVQKGLLNILACKMSNLQIKIDRYAELSKNKIIKIEQVISNFQNANKELNSGGLAGNGVRNNSEILSSVQSMRLRIQILKQEIETFKKKQFKYENTNIEVLKNQLNHLKSSILQAKVAQKSHTNSHTTSAKKKNDPTFKANDFNSSLFDDYEEVYEELDSIGEDQFFHPLEHSTRKYLESQDRTPGRLNGSFENFTSQDEDEDSPSEKRFMEAIKFHGLAIPIKIEIDSHGLTRLRNEGIYLMDREKKCLRMTNLEQNRLRLKGYIE